MKRDIKYIIKRILIGVGIALILGFLKGGLIADVYASTSSYTLYSQDYSVLWSNTITTNQNINVQNVSRVRVNFNDAIAQDSTYQITLKIDLTASDYVPYFNASGVFVNAVQQDSEVATVSSTITPQGSSSFLREAVITYTFKASQTSSSNFWEGSLNHTSRITYLNATISVSKIADNTGEQIANSTQDIINNNNSNTQNIINNQNANTDKEIESQKVCKSSVIDKSNVVLDNRFLNSSGVLSNNNDFGVTDFISINSESKIEPTYLGVANTYDCFYDENKNLLSCVGNLSLTANTYLVIPTNARFIRFSIHKATNRPIFSINSCINGNQALNDSINDTNNTLNDDNVDESSNKAQEFFNDFDVGDTGNLTDIISLPLDFLDRLNDTCSPIVLPIPYFGNLTLPCIQTYLAGFLPENLLTLVRLVVNGFLMYKIIASLVDFINSLKDPNNDDLEVMDL